MEARTVPGRQGWPCRRLWSSVGRPPIGGGQGDQVHPVELAASVAPGVAGGVLGHPDWEQGEPAELEVAADRCYSAEHRERGLRADPLRIVADDDGDC